MTNSEGFFRCTSRFFAEIPSKMRRNSRKEPLLGRFDGFRYAGSHGLRAKNNPPKTKPMPISAMAKSEENIKDNSIPTPTAIRHEPNNSFFLHIKNTPCTSLCVQGAQLFYFFSQSLISLALS